MTKMKKCPADFRLYKDKCIYAESENSKMNYREAQNFCAKRGSIVLPLKDGATYHFIKRWSKKNAHGNLYIGMNFSTALQLPLYSDKTIYQKGISYDFDGSSEKFGDRECVYLKKSISHQPRSTDCIVPMHFLCLWKGTQFHQVVHKFK